MRQAVRRNKRAGLERDGGQVPDRRFIGVIATGSERVTPLPKIYWEMLLLRQRVAVLVHRGAIAGRRSAFAGVKACSLDGMGSSLHTGTTAAVGSAGTADAVVGGLAGRAAAPAGQRSVTRPVPAHSRTAAIPAATDALSA